MAQENYVEGCSMQRPPLLEPNRFCFWKARFETYVKSKDIELWQVIQNGDFYFEVEDSKTKLMKETPAKVTAIKEAKDLATLPLDELVKSLALKAKVTREQTSDDSDRQGESDEEVDKEEAEAFNLLARNFCKFFSKDRSKRELATIAGQKATLLVSVESQRRTRLLLEEHEAIVKMVTNIKMMLHVSWRSTLKRCVLNAIYYRMIGFEEY
ncbi:hypothetical protein Tco_0811367 [Tanacetum coccineum]